MRIVKFAMAGALLFASSAAFAGVCQNHQEMRRIAIKDAIRLFTPDARSMFTASGYRHYIQALKVSGADPYHPMVSVRGKPRVTGSCKADNIRVQVPISLKMSSSGHTDTRQDNLSMVFQKTATTPKIKQLVLAFSSS
ncbi:hypothetical protein A4U49_06025 [Acidithiobacillus ferrivorans]|jgi:hypothetical protein|uniref:hypothetical protein n=1 Tax=Acidithiobacillus ferrivorans TaxID=160808 RepID=UPI000892C4E7|nr:hypothetical protein [Acidithiobacillus ferrivorans]OFA16735.1 hypothetical protein A4U49_06025 [Acidithiobacillus ferrivorans]